MTIYYLTNKAGQVVSANGDRGQSIEEIAMALSTNEKGHASDPDRTYELCAGSQVIGEIGWTSTFKDGRRQIAGGLYNSRVRQRETFQHDSTQQSARLSEAIAAILRASLQTSDS